VKTARQRKGREGNRASPWQHAARVSGNKTPGALASSQAKITSAAKIAHNRLRIRRGIKQNARAAICLPLARRIRQA